MRICVEVPDGTKTKSELVACRCGRKTWMQMPDDCDRWFWFCGLCGLLEDDCLDYQI